MVKRILIVDDSQTARMVIRRCLEIAGFAEAEFREAAHGRDALAILRDTDIDLVLTDLNMPEMTGQALIRRLKSSPRSCLLPVIVISSLPNEREEEYLRSLGVTAILRKPVSPMMLTAAITAMNLDCAEE